MADDVNTKPGQLATTNPGAANLSQNGAARSVLQERDAEADRRGGLYKYGYGYWVRVMTAVFAGILVLGGALWAYNQLSAINIPAARWVMPSTGIAGVPATGQQVELINDAQDPPAVIGSAVISAFEDRGNNSGEVSVTDWQIKEGSFINETRRIRAGNGFTAAVNRPQPIAKFQREYIQAPIAALILIIGAGLIFHYVGRKPKSVDFLIAVDEEMKKVNWSTKKVIKDSTLVVISATFMLAGALFLVDWLLSKFFKDIVGILAG
jgi:preprotein translocase SecE subunit